MITTRPASSVTRAVFLASMFVVFAVGCLTGIVADRSVNGPEPRPAITADGVAVTAAPTTTERVTTIAPATTRATTTTQYVPPTTQYVPPTTRYIPPPAPPSTLDTETHLMVQRFALDEVFSGPEALFDLCDGIDTLGITLAVEAFMDGANSDSEFQFDEWVVRDYFEEQCL